MMFARAAGMAVRRLGRFAGRAAMRSRDARMRGVHPVVPSHRLDRRRRSRAALAPRAAAVRRRRSRVRRARSWPGREALARAGLRPVALGREGRARAHQRERCDRRPRRAGRCTIARRALDALNIAAALSLRGISRQPVAARSARAGGSAGAEDSGRSPRGSSDLLAGSALWQRGRGTARAGSAVVPLRHAGARRRAGGAAHGDATTSSSSSTAPPTARWCCRTASEMLSNGNFHIPGLALALRRARPRARARARRCAWQRCQRHVLAAFSGIAAAAHERAVRSTRDSRRCRRR